MMQRQAIGQIIGFDQRVGRAFDAPRHAECVGEVAGECGFACAEFAF